MQDVIKEKAMKGMMHAEFALLKKKNKTMERD